jgi:Ran GTPase-activating protein (RanGAP) involved in mRNA processing and transport
LEKLDLHSNKIDLQGLEMLAVAGCVSELRYLGIDRCEIKPGMFTSYIEQSKHLDMLRVFNVAQNEIGPTGLTALLERAPNSLHTLLVGDNDLHDRGVIALANSPATDSLLELDLNKNGIGPTGIAALTESEHLAQLLILRVHDNEMSETSQKSLQDSPLGQRLKVLGLKAPRREWGYMPPYDEDEDYYEDV